MSTHPRSKIPQHPDPSLIALGIQQPWLELILRSIKTIEVRSCDTRVRGTIYLYASKRLSAHPAAMKAARKHGVSLDDLPRGVLAGTVEIVETALCQRSDAEAACVPRDLLEDRFAWHLLNPSRLDPPLAVRFLPYGVWFYPFRRKADVRRPLS
jgi:hypothetical protein